MCCEIPTQHNVYILANYSVSSYLNFIPIFWHVLIWLKYDFIHILYIIFPCTLTYNVWHHCADTGSWIRGSIWIFEGKYPYWPWGKITNTGFRLLLDMRKRTYCIKIFENKCFDHISVSHTIGKYIVVYCSRDILCSLLKI